MRYGKPVMPETIMMGVIAKHATRIFTGAEEQVTEHDALIMDCMIGMIEYLVAEIFIKVGNASGRFVKE
jgi:hypothetical protein